MDVGDLRRSTKSVKVKKPQFSEAIPEAAVREGADELTLRGEFGRWRPPLVDADWHAFRQAIYKGIGGKEWEELHYHHRELSQAAGANKPSESQEARALWAMKAAWDRGEEYYDPACKEDTLGRTTTRLELWEAHLKRLDGGLGKNVGMLGKSLLGLAFGFHSLSLLAFVVAMAFSIAGAKLCKICGKALLGRRLALPGPMGCCAFAHIIQRLQCPGEVRAARRALFFFLIKKEPFALTKAVQFKPFCSCGDAQGMCFVGLHLVAAEGESGFSSYCGVFPLELGGIRGPSVDRRSCLLGKRDLMWL